MANLILDPNNWDTYGSPPPQWNGSAYVFVNSAPDMDLVDSVVVQDGDIVSFTANSAVGGSSVTVHYYDQASNDIVLLTQALDAGDTPVNVALPAGGKYYIITLTLGGVGCVSDTLTFTPAAAPSPECNYNCDCDDGHPTETLADLRTYLMIRLGFAAMLASPPPGLAALLDSFLTEAQTLLYRRYKVLRLERWFTWDMTAGTRFYDLADNADTCTKKLDPRRVDWVGISQGDNCWRPLVCGIDPVRYSYQGPGLPDSYEIRQCIEVWPAPADDTWKLRIKGDFGLLPFADDDDVTTIDPEAIKLHALAYAKAHYGQPDAGNLMTALATFLGDLTADSHLTRRYIPGARAYATAVPPKRAG